MNQTNTRREPWSPQSREDGQAVLLALDQVSASSHFSHSKRYPALLRFIVETTLAGKSDSLKERTLDVEVFDRSPHYDTHSDTFVRYTAREARK